MAKSDSSLKKMLRIFSVTAKHFFPSLENHFRKVSDPRQVKKTHYPLRDLFWSGILLFCCRLEARRQLQERLKSDETEKNLKAMLDMVGVPHGDTLDDCFRRIQLEQLEMVRTQMIHRLIRMKVIEKYRLFNRYYLIAADASGVHSFDKKHCEHCLEKKHTSGKVTYYHPILEMKLITSNGFAFSVESEFIENPEGWDTNEKMKQDCEIKAFYRLAPKLKMHFPRLPICLLLDGLYAGAPVFKVCEDYGWKYIIVLTDDDLSSVTGEFLTLREITPRNQRIMKTAKDIIREYSWVNEIEYKTRETSTTHSFFLNVLDLVETKPAGSKTHFRWITNLTVTNDNAHSVAKGGRLRWKIENEGFNTQKNGGYNLEHCYAENPNSAKIFYLLLQIACIIMRLVELGSLLKQSFPNRLGSFENIAKKLTEAFLYASITRSIVNSWFEHRVQIRFDNTS